MTEEEKGSERETMVKKGIKKVGAKVEEVVRDNIRYLQQSCGTAIYQALKALKGF